jgi:hypothetical protein
MPNTSSGSPNATRFVPRSPTPTATPSPTNEPLFRPILEVSPSPPVDVNQEVTFTVVPRPLGAVEYRFNFGDGKTSDWITQSQTTHRYFESKIYLAYAEIRGRARALAQGTKNTPRREVKVVPPLNPTPTSTATSVAITPSPTSSYISSTPIPTAAPTATPSISPPLEVYLSVDKNPTSVGERVTFSISTNLPAKKQHHSYAVDFGDKSKPFRTNSNSIPHTFKTAGYYTVSVTVLGDRTRAHKELDIFVRGQTTPRWLYIIIGLAVIALAYLILRPKFYAHSDWDAPQKPPENVAINYGLYFHSNVSAGQHRLQTDGACLILRRRTQ